MSDLDSGNWRQDRDEYIAGKLLDQDDIAAFRAESEHARLTPMDMVRRYADERAEVESEYPDGEGWRRFGWLDAYDGGYQIIGGGADDVDYPGWDGYDAD